LLTTNVRRQKDLSIKQFITILFLLISTYSFADESSQAYYVECDEGKKFIATSFNIVNGTDKYYAGNLIQYPTAYEIEEKHIYGDGNFSCKVDDFDINITIKSNEPHMGMCGSVPGAKLSLSLNGKQIVKNANINLGCYQTLEAIDITYSPYTEYTEFKFCGHTDLGRPSHFEGCLTYRQKKFLKISSKLEDRPLDALLKGF